MNNKFICSFILGFIFANNVYSADINQIGVCREEKLSNGVYQRADFSVLKFENIKKLVVKQKDCFGENKKLKTLIFESNDIDITLPNGALTTPLQLNPAKDLNLPLDCHAVLRQDIENSEQKIEKYRNIIHAGNWSDVLFNFTRSLERSVNKYSLNSEDIDIFDLEIKFFVINECSEHDWYLNLKENSYTVVSSLSEQYTAYRNVLGSNQINGEFDMTDFYHSNEYKFALSIYEFVKAVSYFDDGNVYERTLNAISESTDNEYIKNMCSSLKDAYHFFDTVNSSILFLEGQVREQELLKQQQEKEEILRIEEQKLQNKIERRARAEQRRLMRDEEDRKKEFKKASKAMNEMFVLTENFSNDKIKKEEAASKMLSILYNNRVLLNKHYINSMRVYDENTIRINLRYYNVILNIETLDLNVTYTEEHPILSRLSACRDDIVNNASDCCFVTCLRLPIYFAKILYTAYKAKCEYENDTEKYKMFLLED